MPFKDLATLYDGAASQCLEALQLCHARNASLSGFVPEPQCARPSCANCSGPQCATIGPRVAGQFAVEASSQLSKREFTQLLQFLANPTPVHDEEELGTLLKKRIEEFKRSEVQVSHQSSERIASPGGPVGSNLGVILHSASIGLLREKGLYSDSAFGYDWHWRAEEAFAIGRKPRCLTKAWTKPLSSLHDALSVDVLDILPLPFVVTGSSCTRQNLRRCLDHLRPLNITLDATENPPITLQFDLDFRHGALRRIFIHVYHPSSGFFTRKCNRLSMGTQIDAGMNFALWLAGKPYDANTFRRGYFLAPPCSKKAAPIGKMWAYLKLEIELGRNLQLQEYLPTFVAWAGRFLRRDPALVISMGDSLVNSVATMFRARMRLGALQRKPKRKLMVDETQQNKSDDMDIFHGQQVTVLGSGSVKLHQAEPSAPLYFRLGHIEAKRILDLAKPPKIYFSVIEIQLRVNDLVVYRKPVERLLTSVQGAEWLIQILHELKVIRETTTSEDTKTTQFSESNLRVVPHRTLLGCNWKNGELQRKLCSGSIFMCSLARGRARVYFRGVQLWVPKHADLNSVFVQWFLAPPDQKHDFECGVSEEQDDPAHRLGIKLKFTSMKSGLEEEEWVKLTGECNVKKLNSLVDFLEGHDEVWTESQSRRFLDRNIGRGRPKISYTS
ncbi:hypothetical protein GQ53DRAFT_881225 [Thozetella sp. PMI_491]|nr:hypothetical protein GQ53DRAFT_881225 [Thozetella sp. PMI_491]